MDPLLAAATPARNIVTAADRWAMAKRTVNFELGDMDISHCPLDEPIAKCFLTAVPVHPLQNQRTLDTSEQNTILFEITQTTQADRASSLTTYRLESRKISRL
jgi:hypothetical protein